MALTNTQYDALMRGYQERQQQRRRLIREREEEVYLRIPELESLDQKVAELCAQSAEQLLSGDASAVDHMKRELQELRQKRLTLLSGSGYPADYLTPPYRCPDCKDTGYINGQKCHCLIQASIDLLYARSRMADLPDGHDFSHFRFDLYDDGARDEKSGMTSLECAHNAFDSAQIFVQNFKRCGGNLLLYGDTGTGKTFLSHCIGRALLDQGCSVIYFTAFQLFRIFEKNVFSKDADASETHEQILDCDLLIIDDLGTEFSNSFTTSQLFLCLNERLLRGGSTVISTNLDMKELRDLYSERTSSRIISSYTPIRFFGSDIRIKQTLAHKQETKE